MKNKLMLLSLMAICLTGCNHAVEPIEDKQEEASYAEEKNEPINENRSSKILALDDADANDTPWSDDLYQAMKSYLGGNILPYVDIGTYPSYVWMVPSTSAKGYLKITGSLPLRSSLLKTFKTAYEKENYKVSIGTGTMEATLAEKNLVVNAKQVSGVVELDVYYTEPYDETTLTDWPSDIQQVFDSKLHKHVIPYVYLGTTNLASSTAVSNGVLTLKITGQNGNWNEKIATNAETIYKAAGWDEPKMTTNSYSSVFESSITLSDGCAINVVIKSSSTTVTDYKTTLCTVTFTEGYYAEGYTSWDYEFDSYKSQFHDHDIPAIYLGTSTPTYSDYISSSNRLLVKGAAWNDQVTTDAKALLEKDDTWKVEPATINNKDGILAYKSYGDGCRVQFTVGPNGTSSTAVAQMAIHYEYPFKSGTKITDWPTDVKTEMTDKLSMVIPFVDLNSDTPETTWSDQNKALTITGKSTFTSNITEQAVAAFTADKWEVTDVMTADGMEMSATKTLTNGDILTATIDAKTSLTAPVEMKVKLDEAFNAPTSSIGWPSDIETSMKDHFNGYVLPYTYLGTKFPYANYSNSTLHIFGKNWDDSILTQFASVMATDTVLTWEIKDGTNGEKIATATNDADGTAFTATAFKNTDGSAKITVKMTEIFKVVKGTWSSTILASMNKNFENHTIPYLYLGTLNPTVGSYTSSTRSIQITGGTYKEEIFAPVEETLKNAGYTVEYSTSSYGKTMNAYILNADGTSFRLYLYPTTSKNANASLRIYYGPKVTGVSTATEWNSDIKALLQSDLGGYELPYLNTGSTTMTASASNGGIVFKYNKKGASTQSFLFAAINTLKAKDPEWEIKAYLDTASYAKVKGTLTQKDGSRVFFCYSITSNDAASLYITYDSPLSNKNAKAWNSDVTSAVEKVCRGEFTLPYLNLNLDDSGVKVTSALSASVSNVKITGGIFHESMFTSFASLLSSDTEHEWSVVYDYSSTTNGKTLVAYSNDFASGKGITLKLFGNENTTWNYSTASLELYRY